LQESEYDVGAVETESSEGCEGTSDQKEEEEDAWVAGERL
jgi:hypothetical protein